MVVKKKSPIKSIMEIAMPTSERQSVRIEKIDNGYLAHHSGSDSKGNYHDKTVFHASKPSITITATPKPSVKKGGK